MLAPQSRIQPAVRYRPDIDGLRAVAVLPVVLYHYRVPGFSGGFIGVDVFFVISGYLITSLIWAEMQAGHFSIAGFYERRARRILPALFAMIAGCFVAGVFLLFPRDLIAFAKSAIAAIFFVANFHFLQTAGYFDAAADVKPLLHTWSLAVEEQYYVLFPALLFALRARGRMTLLGLVSAIAVISFALSVWAVRYHPVGAFYLAPYRFWELMLGALIAVGGVAAPRAHFVREALLVIGIALIAWPIFTYTQTTPFPGLAAVPPCLGAALVIFAGGENDTLTVRMLSSRPFVGLGLVSYSFYLWHWPVFVFAQYRFGAIGAVATAALIALSLALAVVSWRYVERPFRQRNGWFDRKRLIVSMSSAAIAGAAFAGVMQIAKGLPDRYPPDIRAILAAANDIDKIRGHCFQAMEADPGKLPLCRFGVSGKAPTVAIWGDSHSSALVPAMDDATRAAGRSGILLGRSRCPPMLDIMLTDAPNDLCARFNAGALRVLADPAIRTVVLTARWAIYERGTGYGHDSQETRAMVDLSHRVSGEDQRVLFAALLERTIRALLAVHKQVVLVGPIPEALVSLPDTLARAKLYRLSAMPTLPRDDYVARNSDVVAAMTDLAQRYPIQIADPAKVFCDAQSCAYARDGQSLYTDHDHLSVFGAHTVAPMFKGML
jgi:peptidoglycan/LPS O-acetylase OafA/YrhL